MKLSQLKASVNRFLGASETDPDLVRKYLSDLQSENDRLLKRFGVDATLIVLLAIFFLLIVARGVGEFTLFGVKVTQLDVVSIAIPPAIAWLSARLISGSRASIVIRKVYFEITRQAYPAFYETNLDDLVIRSDMPFTDEPGAIWVDSRAGRLSLNFSMISGLTVLLLPLAFFGYAYYVLFRQHHASNVFVWISLVLALSFLGLAIAIGVADVWERESDDAEKAPDQQSS